MKLPRTWGWTGFGLMIMAFVLAGVWALAQWLEWLVPGHGGKLLMVCFILLPLGVVLFAGSRAREAFFSRDDGDDA